VPENAQSARRPRDVRALTFVVFSFRFIHNDLAPSIRKRKGTHKSFLIETRTSRGVRGR
jgi:hypothetical protein